MNNPEDKGTPGESGNREAGDRNLRDSRLARIRALETELAALKQAAGLEETSPRQRGAGLAHDGARLSTVKVPEQFEPPFLRAQEYVARYFSDRIESPDTATISIAGERYVLMRAASLSVEFVQLVTSLYKDKGDAEAHSVANNLLFDLAHSIGKADARSFQQKMGVSDPIENLSAGPIHFAFAGWAFVDISADSVPSPDDDFCLLYEHPYSFESHSWIAKGEQSEHPVCIMNAGYSSGWCEESFGISLVAVETECLAAGGECCRFVMAPPSRIEERLAEHAPGFRATAGSPHTGGSALIPEFFKRRRMEDELQEANRTLERRVEERTTRLESATAQLRLLGSAIEKATEGIVIMERVEGPDPLRITFVNQGFSRITGFTPEDVIGRSPTGISLAEDDIAELADMRERVREGKAFEGEVTAIRKDGSEYELEVHVMPVDNGGESQQWIAILHDVSDRKAHLDALKRQALHDVLTGLPNRVLLHDRIEQSILNMQRQDVPFALLFMDLDGFKEINDTFGHYTGDILLARVGARLRKQLRATDTIARLGGDEFAILLDGIDSIDHAIDLTEKLLRSLEAPFPVEGQNLVVGASIGIVRCPDHGDDADTLMRRADVAMYAAKASHAGASVYRAEDDIHSPARLRLMSELRNCIDDQHLVLHYQPQLDLVSGSTRRVEALVRWHHPDGQQLMPGEFLPHAETSGLIERISRWVLERAIRDAREWQDDGLGLGVSVNLSTRDLHNPHLPNLVEDLLKEYGLPADLLTVEVTESGILGETEAIIDTFARLRDIGIGLSIDDFGTGYSSLVHLKHLPFTELKIDRSFTRDMLDNNEDGAIVRATIALGKELKRNIVAEGVETRAALEHLADIGCDLAQGYYISHGLEKAAFREWLRSTPVFPGVRKG